MSSLVRVKASPRASWIGSGSIVPSAHLRSRQIGHDRDPAAGGFFRGADPGDPVGVTGEIAVREIEAGDVHARP